MSPTPAETGMVSATWLMFSGLLVSMISASTSPRGSAAPSTRASVGLA
jgi:hypothetical protein